MSFRITLGSGRRGGRGGPLFAGLAFAAFGLLITWAAYVDGSRDLGVIGLVMFGSGSWIAWFHRLVGSRGPAWTIPGGLLIGWSVVGAAAAAVQRAWLASALCAFPFLVGLLLLGVLPVPERVRRLLVALQPITLGLVFMAAGVGITVQGLIVGPSEGVPTFAPIVAGLIFFCGGVVAILAQTGRASGLVYRTLVALLITGMTAVSVVFPPSLLFMAPITVLAWMAVLRLVAERITGRDPLGHWSQERVFVLGCGVTLALALLIIGGLGLRFCLDRPRLPAEAPEVYEERP